MLTRYFALTRVTSGRAPPSGDGGGCGDVAAWKLKQIFYEGSGVTAIIIKRRSWHAVLDRCSSAVKSPARYYRPSDRHGSLERL